MITKITKTYTRNYSDSGQVTTYVEWVGSDGKTGRTEGNASNGHIKALLERAAREGVGHSHESW